MENFVENKEVIWKDRKRWCGLPWTFTRYSIVKENGNQMKLVNNNGLLTSRIEEVNLFRVDDISVYQSLVDKIFGVGTLTVYCKDASCEVLEIRKVKKPYKVKALLSKLVHEERQRLGFGYSEFQY